MKLGQDWQRRSVRKPLSLKQVHDQMDGGEFLGYETGRDNIHPDFKNE